MGLGFKTGLLTGVVLHFPPTKSNNVAKYQNEKYAKKLRVIKLL
jgi:hypothetical protein